MTCSYKTQAYIQRHMVIDMSNTHIFRSECIMFCNHKTRAYIRRHMLIDMSNTYIFRSDCMYSKLIDNKTYL
jgi:hypothetical protein